MLQLQIITGSQRGLTRPLTDGLITVGRSKEADLTLHDQSASRLHVEIITHGDSIEIKDLGSSNGTRVNDEKIAGTVALAVTDRITIAKTELILVEESTDIQRLRCIDGPITGEQFELQEGRNVIGRDGGCDIHLTDQSVASLQAAIDIDAGNMILRDLNSPDGTYLNEDRIKSASRLRSGDIIGTGIYQFQVVDPIIDDLQPDFFPGYTLLSRLGTGSIGTTFKARAHASDETVALSIFPPSIGQDPSTKTRLLNNSRAVSRATHPNILPIIESGSHQDYFFVSAAYAHSGSLADIIADEGAVPHEIVCALCLDAARAMAVMADQRVIHGNIKPTNILVDDSGLGMVSDFGLAALLDRNFLAGDEHPYYRAPEELDGEESNSLTDQYALGAVAYHALTGEPPFAGGDTAEVAEAHKTTELADIQTFNPSVPQSLVNLIWRMMANNPDDRFADWQSVISAWEDVVSAGPTTARVKPSRRKTGAHKVASSLNRNNSARYRNSNDSVKGQLRDIPPRIRSALLLGFILVALLFLWVILRPLLTG